MSEEIELLSTSAAIRLRPNMYLGEDRSRWIPISLKEMVCLPAGSVAPERRVNARVDLYDRTVSITDDAPSICLDKLPNGRYKADMIMTELFACRNMKLNHETTGFCKASLATVSALSELSMLEIRAPNDDIVLFLYRRGEPVASEPIRWTPTADDLGFSGSFNNRLTIMFDGDFFRELPLDMSVLRSSLDEVRMDGLNLEIFDGRKEGLLND